MADSGLVHGGANAQRLPVAVLVGFLGAGKTILLNHVLDQSSGIAVLINGFGARPVDQAPLWARAGARLVLVDPAPVACLDRVLQACMANAAGDKR